MCFFQHLEHTIRHAPSKCWFFSPETIASCTSFIHFLIEKVNVLHWITIIERLREKMFLFSHLSLDKTLVAFNTLQGQVSLLGFLHLSYLALELFISFLFLLLFSLLFCLQMGFESQMLLLDFLSIEFLLLPHSLFKSSLSQLIFVCIIKNLILTIQLKFFEALPSLNLAIHFLVNRCIRWKYLNSMSDAFWLLFCLLWDKITDRDWSEVNTARFRIRWG